MATLSVYANADAVLGTGLEMAYATAREGTGTFSGSDTIDNSTQAVGQVTDFNPRYQCHQSYFSFPTGDLPDSAIISQVDFSLVSRSRNGPFTIEARLHDWGLTIGNADWVKGSELAAKPLLASHFIAADGTTWVAGTRYTLGENGTTFQSNVNKTGDTRLVIASDQQRTGTESPYNSAREVGIYYTDWTGTTNDPQLVVTYTLPAPSAPTLGNPAANAQLLHHRPITFSWTHNTNGGGTQTGYRLRITRASDGAQRWLTGAGAWATTEQSIASSSNSPTPGSLPPDFAGESVDWSVATQDSAGWSPYSATRRLHPGFEGFGGAMV